MSISSSNRTVYVVIPPTSKVETLQALALLQDAEIDMATVKIHVSSDPIKTLCKDDAVVVVLTEEDASSSMLDNLALAAAKSGIEHLIGVWQPEAGAGGTDIHGALLKYGTGQIIWDAAALSQALGSDCIHAFIGADGKPITATEIDPHECYD